MAGRENLLSQQFSKAIGVGSAEVLGPNPKRVSLLLSSSSLVRYTVGFGQDPVLDQGLTIQVGANPVYLHVDTVGECITREIRVVASAAGGYCGGIEAMHG